MPLRRLLAVITALLCSQVARGDDITPEDRAFFESKVRPILIERCYECHSAQAKTLRGGLRLDSRDGVAAGGDAGPAIDRENLAASALLTALSYEDAVLKMPPKGKLSETEIAVLTDWVKRGAPDPRTEVPVAAVSAKPERVIDIAAGRKHWAFQPLAIVEPPVVRDAAWCRTPIDQFILAKQEAKGIAPSAEAAPRALLRRAYFDLIGMPPTPDATERFLNDGDARAYEKVVSELLQSQHYGERWGRHWLDLARWAESHGFEHDYDRPTAYHYRDFVIEALNRDLPFDTFVKWQLAGDEYEPNDHLALKATGFLGAGTHSTQITKNQVEKERYDELDDMLNTAGTAFLGLTFGCARCHDHKFDPIPTRDYYRMLATFTTTVRTEIDLVPNPEEHRKRVQEHEKAHKPYVEALARFEAEQLPKRFEDWEQARTAASASPPKWVVLEPSKVDSKGGAKAARQPDGSWLFSGPNAQFDTYTITAACDLAEITAVKIEALADSNLVSGGPGRAANGNFALTNVKLIVGPRFGIGESREPRLVNAKATFEQAGLPVAAAVDADLKSGWAVDPQFGKDHAAVFELGSNVLTDSGCTLTFVLDFQNNDGHNIGRVRVSATDSPRPVGIDDDGVPKAIRDVLAMDRDKRSGEQKAAALAWYKTIDTSWRALNQEVEDHAKLAPKTDGVKALICSEGLPPQRLHTQGDDFLAETHLLRRGDPNQKEEVVTQGFLQVLMPDAESVSSWQEPPPEGWRTTYRRRALAEWMTDTERGAGQLLARVIVNRLWQHHFGTGLVATPSDFGAQGSPPSHPELLDWLANRLIQGGWRLKPLHELIMTSAVYRQTSKIDDARAAVDPDNVLLWRQTRRRLEAEVIRDAMLSVSGLLDDRMFGPGTLDEHTRRRSVYFTTKRSHLIPMMTLFDAPDGLVPLATRSATVVAPQALYLMNSPIVREWASALAARVGRTAGEADGSVVGRVYELTLGRQPDETERARAAEFLAKQTAEGSPESALVDLCHVLLCSSEFIYIE